MKRTLTVFLAICMCLSICVVLASCGHEHTYKTEWSKDATHHWHACEGEDCTEVSDKAEHTWGEGKLVKKDTGYVNEFACTVCGQTKTEDIKSTVTAEEWKTALDFNTDVYVCKAVYSTTDNGVKVTESIEQIANGNLIKMISKADGKTSIDYMEKVEGGHNYYDDTNEPADMNAERTYTKTFKENHGYDFFEGTKKGPKSMIEGFIELYDSFTYDEARKCYVAETVGEDFLNVSITIVDGKLVNVSFTRRIMAEHLADYEIEFSYDAVAITLPTVTE